MVNYPQRPIVPEVPYRPTLPPQRPSYPDRPFTPPIPRIR